MSYHKENLKEQIVEIAWDICKTESWQKVNMRKVAKEAKVSTTAFYRHFKKKDDLKAELMRRGYEIIDEGRKDADTFASWGAHYIRFGLDYPHIYDLMFGNIDLDMSLYPDKETYPNLYFQTSNRKYADSPNQILCNERPNLQMYQHPFCLHQLFRNPCASILL